MQENRKHDVDKLAEIIRDAGGRVVGRTKLQKIAYLLELTGLGEGFSFEYRHYGPYSEQLATAASLGKMVSKIQEEEHVTSWGGFYSVYSVNLKGDLTSLRSEFARKAVQADSIELELAATAAFLAAKETKDPWAETARRKPEKAENGRLENAKRFYAQLREIKTPKALPAI
jgi:uncharacterized protein